jgi:hypothetical protein
MLNEHATGRASWQDQLWNLLMLEHWFRTFIDRRPSAADAAETQAHARSHAAASSAVAVSGW